ncbi:antigen 5 like allergen Cul n 1 [Drosophila obscura]|uniref:antigen 5 like allergen Cul n 1 n=1 Tax=Drosophila obscura TaxID=7282 RepID=UPI001BB1D4CE|nr:antigen 5 like allergen Cul n 1 [Drosophila obscura]
MNIFWIAVLLLLSKLYFISVEIITYKTKWPFHVARKSFPKPTSSPNYCMSQLCPKKVRHLTCDTKFWGPKCGKSHEGVKLKKCKKNIVQLHNKVRNRLNDGGVYGLPRARNIPMVSWDDELAVMAMRITNQCNLDFENSFCVNTFRFPNVAENSDFLDLEEYPAKAMYFFIYKWFLYYKQITPIDVRRFPRNATRKMRLFANMVYKGADKVGCGMLNSGSKRFVTCIYNDKVKPGKRLFFTSPYPVNVTLTKPKN